MAVERDKSRREWILLRMSTRDSVPLKQTTSTVESTAKCPLSVSLNFNISCVEKYGWKWYVTQG